MFFFKSYAFVLSKELFVTASALTRDGIALNLTSSYHRTSDRMQTCLCARVLFLLITPRVIKFTDVCATGICRWMMFSRTLASHHHLSIYTTHVGRDSISSQPNHNIFLRFNLITTQDVSGKAGVLDLATSNKHDCLSCLAAPITARLKSRTTQHSACSGIPHYLVSLTQTPTSVCLLAERFASGVSRGDCLDYVV